MLAHTLDLNLSIAYPHVIARRIDRCRAGAHATIAQTEARAMPWALDDIACQRSLIQRTTCMRTRCCESIELQALAAQLPRSAWQRCTIKEGSRGPLEADFAFVRVTTVREFLQ